MSIKSLPRGSTLVTIGLVFGICIVLFLHWNRESNDSLALAPQTGSPMGKQLQDERLSSEADGLTQKSGTLREFVSLEDLAGTSSSTVEDLVRRFLNAIQASELAVVEQLRCILLERGSTAARECLKQRAMIVKNDPLALILPSASPSFRRLALAHLSEIAVQLPIEEATRSAFLALRESWHRTIIGEELWRDLLSSLNRTDRGLECIRLSESDRENYGLVSALLARTQESSNPFLERVLIDFAEGSHPEEYPDPWLSQMLVDRKEAQQVVKSQRVHQAVMASRRLSLSVKLQFKLARTAKLGDLIDIIGLMQESPDFGKRAFHTWLRTRGLRTEEVIQVMRAALDSHGVTETALILQWAIATGDPLNLDEIRLSFPQLAQFALDPNNDPRETTVVLDVLFQLSQASIKSGTAANRGPLISSGQISDVERFLVIVKPWADGESDSIQDAMRSGMTHPTASLMLTAESGAPLKRMLAALSALDLDQDPRLQPAALCHVLRLILANYGKDEIRQCGEQLVTWVATCVSRDKGEWRNPVEVGGVLGHLIQALADVLEAAGRPEIPTLLTQNLLVSYPELTLGLSSVSLAARQSKWVEKLLEEIAKGESKLRELGYKIPSHKDWFEELRTREAKSK